MFELPFLSIFKYPIQSISVEDTYTYPMYMYFQSKIIINIFFGISNRTNYWSVNYMFSMSVEILQIKTGIYVMWCYD